MTSLESPVSSIAPSSTPQNGVSLSIEGMTCGSCVARVEKALRAAEGVSDASVNLATGRANVHLIDRAEPDTAIQAVRAAGYGAALVDDNGSLDVGQATAESTAVAVQRRVALIWSVAGWLAMLALHMVAPHTFLWHALAGVICGVLLIGPAGRAICLSGLRAIGHWAPNMDALITMGVGTAFIASAISLLAGSTAPLHFEAVGMILTFINAGKLIESRVRREAGGAIAQLAGRIPRMATCWRDEEWREIPAAQLRIGDRVRVVQDGVIPVDGSVVGGQAAVDESAVTGESSPRSRGEGDQVLGGTIIREGTLEVNATGVGRDTAVGRIMTAVEQAQAGKTHMQRLADRVAGVFVPVSIGLAVLTAVLWIVAIQAGWTPAPDGVGTLGWAVRCAVAVLVIACPCAMGLATPVAVLVSTGRAALDGILVRSPVALEAAGQADVVLFDKTGTLTTGRMQVRSVYDDPVGEITPDDISLLRVAASAERFSQHPLAKAIVSHAYEQGLELDEPGSFRSEAGRGVHAEIAGREVLVGSPAFIVESGIDLEPVDQRVRQLAADGQTVVVVAVSGKAAGLIGISDTVRERASDAIEALGRAGYEVDMITGDGHVTAQFVAGEIGIHTVCAEVRPEGKLEEVERRRKSDRIVVFVGDGTNDAPALSAADAGIAFATGTDIANQAADISLVGDDILAVPRALLLARRSVRIIKQNLFWAFFYNVVAIPLAALGQVPPGWAAGAMMFSSISVVLNSLRLRKEVVRRADMRGRFR